MQHRSLHLVSALGLHSCPRADVRAAPHCFSLGEGSPQWTKAGFFSSYCESMCPKQSGTVITRPQLRSLPPRPTAPKVTCVERVLRILPCSSFTSPTTWAVHGSEKRGGRVLLDLIPNWVSIVRSSQLELKGGKIICNIKRNDVFKFLQKKEYPTTWKALMRVHLIKRIAFILNGQPNYYILNTELKTLSRVWPTWITILTLLFVAVKRMTLSLG